MKKELLYLLEQAQIVTMEAQWLDDETVLQKLPNITVDEIPGILQRKGLENQDRFTADIGSFEEEEQPEDIE